MLLGVGPLEVHLVNIALWKVYAPLAGFDNVYKKYSDFVRYISEPDDVSAITFNGNDNIKAYEIAASINNYDIVKELGRDNIYKTISSEYAEWLNSDEAKEANNVEKDVDKYTKKFIDDLDSNYKKTDSSTDFMIYNDDNVKPRVSAG